MTEPLGSLHQLRLRVDQLGDILEHLAPRVLRDLEPKVAELWNELEAFSAQVCILGQVKSGKTSLVNGLAGTPALLPSDINPWTTANTTLHLNMPGMRGQRAVFRFFTEEEWQALSRPEGELGALTHGFRPDMDAEDLARHMDALRDRLRERLGERYEMLLGKSHVFAGVDTALLERYVCEGDWFDDDEDPDADPDGRQGRYADLTRSADIYMEVPGYPMPVSLCDTPGVNDPLLLREQVTLQSLSASDLCVVVLSAHQALSSLDVALLRVVTGLRDDQVIVFVNRIDELTDPRAHLPLIETDIRKTLARQGLAEDIPILFGSALWAEAAQARDLSILGTDSLDALEAFAGEDAADGIDPIQRVLELSGIPKLRALIGERLARGVGLQALEAAAGRALNFATQTEVLLNAGIAGPRARPLPLSPEALGKRLEKTAAALRGTVLERLRSDRIALRKGLSDTVTHFMDAESRALTEAVRDKAVSARWSNDGNRLRASLRQHCVDYAEASEGLAAWAMKQAVDHVEAVYRDLLGEAAEGVTIRPLTVPPALMPQALGRTLAFDVEISRWKRWFPFRSRVDVMSDALRKVVDAEIVPMVARIDTELAVRRQNEICDLLDEFFASQYDTLIRIAGLSGEEERRAARQELGLRDGAQQRLEDLAGLKTSLSAMLAQVTGDGSGDDLRTGEAAQ